MILNITTVMLFLQPPSTGSSGVDRYPPNSVTLMPCFWRIGEKYTTPGKHMVLGNLIVFSANPVKSDFQVYKNKN